MNTSIINRYNASPNLMNIVYPYSGGLINNTSFKKHFNKLSKGLNILLIENGSNRKELADSNSEQQVPFYLNSSSSSNLDYNVPALNDDFVLLIKDLNKRYFLYLFNSNFFTFSEVFGDKKLDNFDVEVENMKLKPFQI
jgi:hypothetical protein